MTNGQVHIRCAKCGTFNVDAEHCVQCGHTLNMVQQREQERKKENQERIAKELAQEPLAIEKFLHRMMNHPWLLVSLFFKGIYGIWVVVMAIAMFIAWLIGIVVA